MKKPAINQKMVDDARELYVKFKGRHHRKIREEMRRRGWRFDVRVFYSRKKGTELIPGWPQRFGWRKLLRSRDVAETPTEFETWLNRKFPEWSWDADYQRYIYQKLQRITTGECRRLMIFLPPRHGKSEMVTIRFVAWCMLQNTKLNVILGSYNQRLADKFSRRIRRIVLDSLPKNVRDPKTTRLNTASEWETPDGGGLKAVGVGAGITGFGAGLIVIDDPVKSRSEAESEAYRDRASEWFSDDLYTRMEPDAAIILIQTRWHEDDLAGRLQNERVEGGEEWEVIRLPAFAETDDPLGREPGEPLNPARFDGDALLRYKKKLGTYSFSALYQQSPEPADGGRFKREWFRQIVDAAPEGLRWKRGYDLAASIKTSADYTASFRCAFDKKGNLYIADGFRRRIEYPEQRRYIIERIKTERNTEHGIESAIHGKAVVQDLRSEQSLRRFAFREIEARGDKLTRALSWLNLAEASKVFLVRGPWIADFVDEIVRFPSGKHDDQVDAVSIAVHMLSEKDNKVYFF